MKTGFVPAPDVADPVRDGALPPDEAASGHSLSSDWIRRQLARTHAALGRDRIEVVFLHNPELAGPPPGTITP